MVVAEIVQHVGEFCAVATRHGIFYGEMIRLSSAMFLIRPRLPCGSAPFSVRADEITGITALPDPR